MRKRTKTMIRKIAIALVGCLIILQCQPVMAEADSKLEESAKKVQYGTVEQPYRMFDGDFEHILFDDVNIMGFNEMLHISDRYYDQLDEASIGYYQTLYEFYKDAPTGEELMFPISIEWTDLPSTTTDQQIRQKASDYLNNKIWKDLQSAYVVLLLDAPEINWIIGLSFGYRSSYRYSTSINDSGTKYVTVNYEVYFKVDGCVTDVGDRESFSEEIQKAKNTLENEYQISNTDTRYQKAKKIHDFICQQVDYENSIANYGLRQYQTPYSVFFDCDGDGMIETVCSGYSKTFKILCREYGLPCLLIRGLGNGGDHAWNYVQMEDGAWYAVDVTWDDQKSGTRYEYFLAGENSKGFQTTFAQEHIPNGSWLSDTSVLVQYPALSSEAFDPEKPVVLPSVEPSEEPSVIPSIEPSIEPSVAPSELPSIEPSVEPSEEPSIEPSVEPSEEPSELPSVTPSIEPSVEPSVEPSEEPSELPSVTPSIEPSVEPSEEPSELPSIEPSVTPSIEPSVEPSEEPSELPSAEPSVTPSIEPSVKPSEEPSVKPSEEPSELPSIEPSVTPSEEPSVIPSVKPSVTPSAEPSITPPSKKPAVSVKMIFTDKNTKAMYKVKKVSKTSGEIELIKVTSSAKGTYTIPSYVKYKNYKLYVTSIASKACYKNKKITKLTIGDRVAKIGSNAFYGCSKITNVTIKTTKLSKSNVGSSAWKGLNSKVKVKIPNSKKKVYPAMLKARGITSKQAKITS